MSNRPGTPVVWGETSEAGDIYNMSTAEQQRGWPLSIDAPERQRFNFFFKRTSEQLKHLFKQGVPDWSADVMYQQYDIMRSPVNSLTYIAKAATTGDEPSASPMYWERFGEHGVLPFKTMPSGTNANTLTASGFYSIHQATNRPAAAGSEFCEYLVVGPDATTFGGVTLQIAGCQDGSLAYRTATFGVFTEWQAVPTMDDLDNKLDAIGPQIAAQDNLNAITRTGFYRLGVGPYVNAPARHKNTQPTTPSLEGSLLVVLRDGVNGCDQFIYEREGRNIWQRRGEGLYNPSPLWSPWLLIGNPNKMYINGEHFDVMTKPGIFTTQNNHAGGPPDSNYCKLFVGFSGEDHGGGCSQIASLLNGKLWVRTGAFNTSGFSTWTPWRKIQTAQSTVTTDTNLAIEPGHYTTATTTLHLPVAPGFEAQLLVNATDTLVTQTLTSSGISKLWVRTGRINTGAATWNEWKEFVDGNAHGIHVYNYTTDGEIQHFTAPVTGLYYFSGCAGGGHGTTDHGGNAGECRIKYGYPLQAGDDVEIVIGRGGFRGRGVNPASVDIPPSNTTVQLNGALIMDLVENRWQVAHGLTGGGSIFGNGGFGINRDAYGYGAGAAGGPRPDEWAGSTGYGSLGGHGLMIVEW